MFSSTSLEILIFSYISRVLAIVVTVVLARLVEGGSKELSTVATERRI